MWVCAFFFWIGQEFKQEMCFSQRSLGTCSNKAKRTRYGVGTRSTQWGRARLYVRYSSVWHLSDFSSGIDSFKWKDRRSLASTSCVCGTHPDLEWSSQEEAPRENSTRRSANLSAHEERFRIMKKVGSRPSLQPTYLISFFSFALNHPLWTKLALGPSVTFSLSLRRLGNHRWHLGENGVRVIS